MPYVPDWQPLAAALERVMATGATEDNAKLDICRAVADRKIDVRVRIAASEYNLGGRSFSDGNVGVPLRLNPQGFRLGSFTSTEPMVDRANAGEHYTWTSGWSERSLDLIELSTRGVRRILCGDDLAAQLGSALTERLGTLTDDGAASDGTAGTAKEESDATKALAARI